VFISKSVYQTFKTPKGFTLSLDIKEKTFLRYGEKGFNAFIIHTVYTTNLLTSDF